MKRKISILIAALLVLSLFSGCSRSVNSITLDDLIKANSFEALTEKYGVYKLIYDYGSEEEDYIEYVSPEDVLKVKDNRKTFIYYGEKCAYYLNGSEMYALLNDYENGKSYKSFGNILEENNELYKEELREIKEDGDGYFAISALNGENVVLSDGQKLTAEDEIEYSMTLNKDLTVKSLTATVKYATLSEDTYDSADETQDSSSEPVDLEKEMKNNADVGYERRLFSLNFEDADDEDYAKFETYKTLKSHANPTAENTVSITLFEGDDTEGKSYFCTKGDTVFVSQNGYYKDKEHQNYCADSTVTVNENIIIYLF